MRLHLASLSPEERRSLIDTYPETRNLSDGDKRNLEDCVAGLKDDIIGGLDKKGKLVRRQHCQVCHVELVKVLLCGGW